MSDAPHPFPQRGDVASLVRARDWASTSLGAPEQWPPSLRAVLRLMLTSRYAMWLGWGPELLFFYNDAYREQTLGVKHPWALGRPADEVWAEAWDQIGPRIEHVLRTGEATWDEGLLLFLERSGYSEETYHTFSYSPALDDSNTIRGLFCVVIEETARVLGERRIALLRDFASELGRATRTAQVLDAIDVALARDKRDIPFSLTYLLDDDGKTARLVARSRIDEEHPGCPERIDLAAREDTWPLASVIADLHPIQVPLRGGGWPSGAWGKPVVDALVLPIAQAGQEGPAGVFVAGLNPHRRLDERYQSFLELFVGQLASGLDNARAYESEKMRAEALAQIDRAKTAFFSNVSHEFRTPLTLMLGPTGDALASPDRALRGEALEIVHRNELRLLKLVNSLLDFSRIEAGRAEAVYEPTDLSGLTRDLASAFRSAMERGGLRYEVDCPALTAPVYVDRDMWEKIVLNLLSNALKFTLEGHVRISLRERDGDDAVELAVEDSGAGIPAEELPRMFERFHRIERTPARTHEGSGIGLALVRDLAELHGGRIAVTSELGRGTRFVVTVPKGSAHLPAQRVEEKRARTPDRVRTDSYLAEALRWVADEMPETGNVASSPDGASQTSAQERVLVVDDNADMREYVARLLRTRWHVEMFSDGEAALAAIRRAPPDIVVSDVMMPRIDGFALVQRLRADPHTRTLPIILLSARAGEEATAEGLRAGANDYVIKPFSARELMVRVASQLTIAQVRKEAEAEKEAQRRIVQSLFVNAPAGIALIRGDDLIVEFANPMALQIWGKSEEVIGKSFLDALPELRGHGFDELMRQVMRTREPFVGEEVPVTFDRGDHDETLHLKFVYAPVYNEQGTVDAVATFGFDVTAQVVARHRAVLGATIGRVFVTESKLADQLRLSCEALVAFGADTARIWTYNGDQAVLELRAHAELGDEPSASAVRIPIGSSGIARVARERKPYFASPIGEDPDLATEEWTRSMAQSSLAAYPLQVGDRLVGVMAVVSKRAMTGPALETLATTADQIAVGIERDSSERFRDLFIGMLGHDLRNPLNAVNMAVHLLAGGELSPKQGRALDRIRTSAARMARMITQVLDFTRVRSGGGIPIQRVSSDIHVICAQAVEELATAYPERVVNTYSSGDGTGRWDPDRLAQVFSNVVGNAVVHGRQAAPVRVAVDATGPTVVCSVHNDGPAIPPALLGALFDPFRRAAHGKTTGTQGLGLGLFIAQHIVVAHGGSLKVRSDDLEGTVFTFEIPRHQENAS